MRISKRNTYLVGAVAVVAGLALIIIALVVMSDGSGSAGDAASTGPRTTPADPADRAGAGTRADQRRALPLIGRGTPPPQVQAPLRAASKDGRLGLAGLKGSPVVLHIWSADCAPCRGAARLVQATWERWGRRGVVFMGLSVDPDAQDAVRFARRHGLTYPVTHDRSARSAKAYGARRLPETFFISSTGQVVGHVIGRPSLRQMEFGAGAARSGRAVGTEKGTSSVPLG